MFFYCKTVYDIVQFTNVLLKHVEPENKKQSRSVVGLFSNRYFLRDLNRYVHVFGLRRELAIYGDR